MKWVFTIILIISVSSSVQCQNAILGSGALSSYFGIDRMLIQDEIGSNLNYHSVGIPLPLIYRTKAGDYLIQSSLRYNRFNAVNNFTEGTMVGRFLRAGVNLNKRIDKLSTENSQIYLGADLKFHASLRRYENPRENYSYEGVINLRPNIIWFWNTGKGNVLRLNITPPLASFFILATRSDETTMSLTRTLDYNFTAKYTWNSTTALRWFAIYEYNLFRMISLPHEITLGSHILGVGLEYRFKK